MIVSADRFADLRPYCDQVCRSDPKRWSEVFPWEFPQDGTQIQEETFLLGFFPQSETYMQGFRFLKQVWYCIALYNFQDRIPLFIDWWLAKPNSVELLSDASMRPWLLSKDAVPSTFFSEELPQYGEKFLRTVIPSLQQTITRLIDQKEAIEQASIVAPIVIPQAQAMESAGEDGDPQSGQSVDSSGDIVRTTVSVPSSDHLVVSASARVPYSAPAQLSQEEAGSTQATNREADIIEGADLSTQRRASRERKTSYECPPPPDIQITQRKRGYSGSKRQNTRGGHNAQPYIASGGALNPHHAPIYMSDAYAQTQIHGYGHPRGMSDGYSDFVPAYPQSHPSQSVQPNAQFAYPFGQTNHALPSYTSQDARFARIPSQEYQYNRPFGDRSNFTHPQPAMGDKRQTSYHHANESFRGKSHRNNIGSRGGKFTRGNSAQHRGGRNTSGRQSFTSDERPRFVSHGNGSFPTQYEHTPRAAFPSKQRRGSLHQDQNWRMSSTWPQANYNEQQHVQTKENMPPFERRDLTSYQRATSHQLDTNRTSGPGGPTRGHGSNKQSDFPREATNMHLDHPNFSVDPAELSPEERCGQDWIGERCTYATGLVATSVPEEMSPDHVCAMFSPYGEVQVTQRAPRSSFEYKGSNRIVFLDFNTAAEARQALLGKPQYWRDGRRLKLEVARAFWGEDHDYYHFNKSRWAPNDTQHRRTVTRMPSILKRPMKNSPATRENSVERQAAGDTQSSDATPIPSTSSTPKKFQKNKTNKKKANKDKEDLRKASLATQVDEHSRSISASARIVAASVDLSTKQDADLGTGDVVGADSLLSSPAALPQEQPLDNGRIDAVTPLEPLDGEINPDGTRLRVPVLLAVSGSSRPAIYEDGDPATAKSDNETTSPLAFAPTNTISVRLPADEKDLRACSQGDDPKQVTVDGSHDDPSYTATKPKGLAKKAWIESNRAASSTQDGTEDASGRSRTPPIGEDRDARAVSSSTASAAPSKTARKRLSSGHSIKGADDTPLASSTLRPAPLDLPQSSMSLVTTSLPTPAFITAPSTPASQDGSPQEPHTSTIDSTRSTDAAEDRTLQEGSAFASAPLNEGAKDSAEALKTAPQDKMPSSEGVKTSSTPLPTSTKKVEKEDKSKGPAQTESYSLFGKKKEKKPKGGKKGTLKGKPKGDGNDDGASRAVSGSSVLSTDLTANNANTYGDNSGNMTEAQRGDTKLRNATKKSRKTNKNASNLTAAEPTTSDAIQPESPSKRKTLSSFFANGLGIFTGGQKKPSLHISNPAPPSTNCSLTAQKDRLPQVEIERAEANPHSSGSTLGGEADPSTVDKAAEMPDDAAHENEEVSTGPNIDLTNAVAEEEGKHPEHVQVGLGVTREYKDKSIDVGSDSVKGKKKQKGRKSSAKSMAKEESTSSPVSTDNKSLKGMFRFGEENPMSPGAPPVHSSIFSTSRLADNAIDSFHNEDERVKEHETPTNNSDAFSDTDLEQSEATASAVQSPVSGRKLTIKPPGADHIVQAKPPTWMKKRPVFTSRRSDTTPPDTETDETETDNNNEEDNTHRLWIIQLNSNQTSSAASEGTEGDEVRSTTEARKLYVYVGKGLDDNTSDSQALKQADVVEVEDEGEPSKELVQSLAKQELMRLSNGIASEGPTDATEEQPELELTVTLLED